MAQRASRGAGGASPRTVLAYVKWFIVVCALLVACAHLAYFGGFRIGPGALRQLQQSSGGSTAQIQGGSLTRYELGSGKQPGQASSSNSGSSNSGHQTNWATLVAKASLHEEAGSEIVSPAKGLLLCMDADPNCNNMLKDGPCRPSSPKLDIPLWTCKKFCGVCKGLASTIAQSLDMEIRVTDKAPIWAGSCNDDEEEEQCLEWQKQGLCSSKPRRMLGQCRSTCGFCAEVPEALHQDIDGNDHTRHRMQCYDSLDICPYLAQSDLCYSPEHWWIAHVCPASCKTCDMPGASPSVHQLSTLRPADECEDYSGQCGAWKMQGQCSNNNNYMLIVCARTCEMCDRRRARDQSYGTMSEGPAVLGLDETSALTFTSYARAGTRTCVDARPDSCPGWAAAGECRRNPSFMTLNCQLSCGTCASAQQRLKQPLQQVLLNNGVVMPTVAFGTAGLGEGTRAAVAEAVKAGYRHFDSAQAYEWYNEAAVGQALNESGVPRDRFFVTTKVHPKSFSPEILATAVQTSLRELRSSYLDLLLLHYPRCWQGLAGCSAQIRGTWQHAWHELEQLYSQGVVKAIGVSNFDVGDLKELFSIARIRPQVVQIHVDPLAQAGDIVQLCASNGIQVEAYSALGTQYPLAKSVMRKGLMVAGGNPVLTNPVVVQLAEKLKRSPAQVVLRWALQRGLVVLPRSSNPGRQRENLDLFSFELSDEDMDSMEKAPVATA